MKRIRQTVVTKRDGTVERFSFPKLNNCLAVAMRSLAYDPRLAGPLTKAVALHLQEWTGTSPPTTSYVYRCVLSVLQQTGLSDIADVLATHRRERRIRRARIQVVDPAVSSVRGEPWRKSVLVESLQSRYGLRHAVSRFMAGQIEARVFALNYRLVSRSFVAELTRNEVLAWGLADGQALGVNVAATPPVESRQPEEEIT